MPEVPLDQIQAETFAPWVATSWTLEAPGGGALAVDLVTVKAHETTRTKGFSVVFQGPPAPALPQGTYRLQRSDGLACHLFLVPVGPGTYEAVFNRLVEPGPSARSLS